MLIMAHVLSHIPAHPFNDIAGWIEQIAVLPILYRAGLMQWSELSFGWTLVAVYGITQMILAYAVCVPLERLRPLERWTTSKPILVDVFYTFLARVGVLPIMTFVLFYAAQVQLDGFLADRGYVPPMLETIIPALFGHPIITFAIYALILDFTDYWRHRLSHRFSIWYALHAVHHAQRQMTFWSDDRNHIIDEILSFLWFMLIGLLIGIPPLQFPILILMLRFVESLSHANTTLSFGKIGDRLLVSPRFHRTHHGILAAGQKSCNYGAVFPLWDIIFQTADFTRTPTPTGDPTAPEAMATGTYLAQQWSGIAHTVRALRG
ncbi:MULTISPECIES: sterol desaturase family protein [Acidiphilium]|uniref:Sterol desaturase/sphingolipid hydroxylase, fatty acid hydroxylase superfamily n=1 Tax=Acidiphilium rubrum TaxID=526 RepID=A0A8G2CI94_ACIRU|nr:MULTISPECIES: sterol desaturase family protein [Acidiphilium]SIQ21221.1 Sterol desaturase/sphingolipid hydroxylase, fatty acid hydroxylase superfamily [Acidiphilium rubrum]